MTTAYLRREQLYIDRAETHEVRIGKKLCPDDGLRIEMGTVEHAWWDLPLPACPDCGGELVWAEAGYVAGTRGCLGCGSLFSVQTESAPPVAETEPETFCFACDNGHRWQATEEQDELADHRCPECGEYWQ